MRSEDKKSPSVGTIWNEVNSWTLWLGWALTSIVVAVAGPFGTFDTQGLLWRLSYWSVLIAVAILMAVFLRVFWRARMDGRPAWQEDAAVAVSLSLVFGPSVVMLNRLLAGDAALEAMGYWLAMGVVLAIAAIIILARRFLIEYSQTKETQTQRDRLLQRLEVENGARLSRISSDNHHIRIVTNDGTEHRVLMRLRDAVNEIDVEPGFCVHRSHWVSLASIKDVGRDAGREVVKLTCGTSVPVGPKYRKNLVDAGVISD